MGDLLANLTLSMGFRVCRKLQEGPVLEAGAGMPRPESQRETCALGVDSGLPKDKDLFPRVGPTKRRWG